MSEEKPKHYEKIREQYPEYVKAVEALGKAVRDAGPLDEKTALLIQLGAAAAMRSEGSVTSHARRAVRAGVSRKEIDQALISLTSVIGFPTVAAALKWTSDELD